MTRRILLPTLALALASPLAARPAAPGAPIPVSPAGEARVRVATACPSFHWSAADGAAGYQLEIVRVGSALDAEPDITPVVTRRLPAGVTSWAPNAAECLVPGEVYGWSVAAVDGAGAGRWSDTSLFDVAPAPAPDEIREALDLLRRYVGSREPDDAAKLAASESAQGPDTTHPATPPAPPPTPYRALAAPLQPPAPGVSAPTLSSYPALSVDGQIHMGSSGSIFQDSKLLLWSGSGSTAIGSLALAAATGHPNTAVGGSALTNNTTGTNNTAIGYYALRSNFYGANNTAVGTRTLSSSLAANANTGVGSSALGNTYTGEGNTALGAYSMQLNTSGNWNTALGLSALKTNTTGSRNTAVGNSALLASTTSDSTAVGYFALSSQSTGYRNSAVGYRALGTLTLGHDNIAFGHNAGTGLTTGSSNILIGAYPAASGDSGFIRIGNSIQHSRAYMAGVFGNTNLGATLTAVYVDSTGELGTGISSRRFKTDIRDMGDLSAKALELRPVTFRYKRRKDGVAEMPTEVGLIAEEVAEVLPELVTREPDGTPRGVRYSLLSALLLNELQKQHRELTALRREVASHHKKQ